jgi:hypothetical protein
MRSIVVALVLVGAAGCGWQSETEKWRRSAEDYKTQLETANAALDQARTDFKEQSTKSEHQLQKLSNAMVSASSRLDPVAIMKIYQDHRDLTDVVRQLDAEIAAAVPKDGEVMLADAQLRFDATNSKGRSVIRLYLDYNTDPFFQSELAETEHPALAVPYNIAAGFYDELFKASRAGASAKSFFALDDRSKDEVKDEIAAKLADTQFSARRDEIDTRYKDAVNSEFSGYLKRDTPRSVPKSTFLGRQFRTPGRHEIRVELEPKTPVWDVLLTATKVANGKDQQTIKYWQLNASTTPDLKNIPRMVFWVRYRPDDQK